MINKSETYGYVVKLWDGVWLTGCSDGDPPRTLVIENAILFPSGQQAQGALSRAIKNNPHRNFEVSAVQKVLIKYEVVYQKKLEQHEN